MVGFAFLGSETALYRSYEMANTGYGGNFTVT